ncbi:GNAT family N-acetyltransferase [Asticcacaulis machinosus]|uniref:GNAT family N-acetyltransferase n=1 Tax=Asticcacaulis machinosus TaxID=2984211 RepID=A0ABT5HKL8_9CAUL|nr:GNAT family N-acetyltransferase [Asticcacaulis machinosus]MDC7676768.1 GNAT family N-acetyltransferase [Asticcacaulis machinosus]
MIIENISHYDPDISIIHEQNFDFGWKDSEFIEILAKNTTLAKYVKINDKIQSFVFLSYISQEAEILTLATRSDLQNRGMATALLTAVIDELKGLGGESIFLEVAVDNPAALSLYKKLGFERVGLRKSYYSRRIGPPVDGHVLRLNLA